MTDQTRADFEAHFQLNSRQKWQHKDGSYKFPEIQAKWEGYLAGVAKAAPTSVLADCDIIAIANRHIEGWIANDKSVILECVTAAIREALRSAAAAPGAELEPVAGDLLPPVGSKVLIHLGDQDEWVEHTVTGYYVWSALSHQIKEGERHAYRVFVRVVDANGYDNARLLADVRRAS